MRMVYTSSLRLDPLTELGVGGRDSPKDEAEDGERITPGRTGDVKLEMFPTDGEVWTTELDRLGGHPNDETEETEHAEVRHVDGVSEAEKSHGEEDAEYGADDETVDEMEPREL